jgi:ABC-2 type transport system ATP-binding protein
MYQRRYLIVIEVKNLVKRYGDHLAVDHLSFNVKKGQIYGFLGPNGAGKSTTMNIMTGYIASTEGEVFIDGHNILEEPEAAKKCIGYLPEQPPLYFDMTVGEYMKFASELKKIPKAKREESVEEVMNLVGIEQMKDRLIKNLSKGYKQRVGLAQAILGYPEIIILDEPTVGLDPKQIIEIRDLIKKLSEKHTVILSSHILSEVSAVCDYIMIINHGKLVASDTTENLSKMTFGSNTLEVSIKGKKSEIEKLFESISLIQSLEWKESREEGIVSCVIKTEEKDDIREELFYLMAENQKPILKMQSTKVSLEDVFLELTGNDQPGEDDESEIGGIEESDSDSNEAEGKEKSDHDSDEAEGSEKSDSDSNEFGSRNKAGSNNNESEDEQSAEEQEEIRQ